MYISQDPIGLAGNNPRLYGYVKDVNSWVDRLGLMNIPESFINKYKDLIEANKDVIPGRVVDVDADMAEAWKWYNDAQNAASQGRLPVLGTLEDVQSTTKGSNYYYRLMSERWTPAINDIWIDALTESKSPFLLVSPTDNKSLSNLIYGETIYARELRMLEAVGYNVPRGDKSISSKNTRYIKPPCK